MKVNIDDVMLAFELANNDYDNQVFYIRKENMFVSENDDEFPEIAEAAEECEDEDDYWVKVPDRYAQNEYGMMEDFIYSLENETAREWLSNAIRGKGAFRRFRGACERFHILDDWYEFEEDAKRNQAVQWCEANGIEYEMQLFQQEKGFDWNDEEQFTVEEPEEAIYVFEPIHVVDITAKNCPKLVVLLEAYKRSIGKEDIIPDDLIEETERFLSGKGRVCALSDNGKFIGYIKGEMDAAGIAVDEIYVDPANRRKGYGRQLVQAFEKYGEVKIYVPAENNIAKAFVQAIGYGKMSYISFEKK